VECLEILLGAVKERPWASMTHFLIWTLMTPSCPPPPQAPPNTPEYPRRQPRAGTETARRAWPSSRRLPGRALGSLQSHCSGARLARGGFPKCPSWCWGLRARPRRKPRRTPLVGVTGNRVVLWEYLKGRWSGEAAAKAYKGVIKNVEPRTGGAGCDVRAGSRRNPITKTEQTGCTGCEVRANNRWDHRTRIPDRLYRLWILKELLKYSYPF